MEFSHSNKSVLADCHPHKHDNPVSIFNVDSTKVILKAISKAQLQEDVRLHLLEKFFEELGSYSMEAMQAEMKEASPHSKERDHKDDRKDSMECAKDEMHFKLRKDTDEKQSRNVSPIPSNVLNSEKAYLMEGMEVAKQGDFSQSLPYENLISFLKEASDCGGLVLKDADSVLQAYLKAFSEQKNILKRPDDQAKEETISGNSILAGNFTKDNSLKERENSFCPKGLCPLDNLHCAVPKATAHSPPKATHAFSANSQQKDNYPLTKDTPCRLHHVNDFSCTCSNAIQIKKVGTANISSDECVLHPPQASRDFRGAQVVGCSKEGDTHVENNSTKLNFLEAAKKAILCTNSPLAENRNEGNLAQSSAHVDFNSPILKVDNHVFHKRMEICKFSVIGKVTLLKGEEPWTWSKLKEKLDVLWGFNSDWRLISLGKGFFHIILHSQEELNKIWSRSVLHLKPGVLRIQRWTFGFDPSKERSTRTQVWFRILQLPWCLWDPSIINGIAQRIGVPLRIDKTTLEGNYGHFARVLVEVDVSKPITSSVLLECDNKLLEIKIVPENLPSFCKGCSSIGHSAGDCKILNRIDSINCSPKLETAETFSIQRGNNLKSSKRESHTSEWRKKKVQVTGESSSARVIPSKQSDKISTRMNIVETVTDFSAQIEDHSTKNVSSDCLIFSNQFSVLHSEDEVGDVVQGNDTATPQDSNIQLCDEEEEIIPKLPHRWSDILDEEDDKEKTYSLQEVNDSIMRATSKYHHSFNNMSEFRAQLDEVWITRDDSKFDRDMNAEIEPLKNISRSSITHLPKKDKKVKIGFRHPQRQNSSPS